MGELRGVLGREVVGVVFHVCSGCGNWVLVVVAVGVEAVAGLALLEGGGGGVFLFWAGELVLVVDKGFGFEGVCVVAGGLVEEVALPDCPGLGSEGEEEEDEEEEEEEGVGCGDGHECGGREGKIGENIGEAAAGGGGGGL